jgi:glycosyltransferase involved in cell wall biosynthesis
VLTAPSSGVVVGIATRGDRSLLPLLSSLHRQSVPPLEVVIASTSEVVLPTQVDFQDRGVVVRLIVTGRHGYVHNRNAVLAAAYQSNASWLAWLDDDEEVVPEWLAELLRVAQDHDARVVLGPVVRIWPPRAPEYIVRADLPRRSVAREGPFFGQGNTGNLLHSLSRLRDECVLFDEAFNETGGEDTHFIAGMRSFGWTVAWSPHALAREAATDDMLRPAWYVKRAFRNGRTVRASRGRPFVVRRMVKSLVILFAAITLRRRDLMLRSAWEAAFVSGTVLSLATDSRHAKGR